MFLLYTYILSVPHLVMYGFGYIDDIFMVMGSKVKVTDNIFYNALFKQRHINRWFAIEAVDHVLVFC